MISIKKILFGEKRFFKTSMIGTFEAKVRYENSKKEISWCSTIKIEGYSDEIVIILDGNALEPDRNLIDSATWIIENIKKIDLELIDKISRSPNLIDKFKGCDLSGIRLVFLSLWEKQFNSFELSYDSRFSEDLNITAILQNKKIIEIE